MNVIYKYELHDGLRSYDLPKGARILSVAIQRDVPCMWVVFEPLQPMEQRKILLTGTGVPFDGGPYKFIGTMLTPEYQRFVFHVFEEVAALRDSTG